MKLVVFTITDHILQEIVKEKVSLYLTVSHHFRLEVEFEVQNVSMS